MYPDTDDTDVMCATRARVVFADDHRMVAEGITRLLDERFDLAALAQMAMRCSRTCAARRPTWSFPISTCPAATAWMC